MTDGCDDNRDPRSGHASLTKHFEAWKSFGMTLGEMEDARVQHLEASGGCGRADFPTASVTAH